MKNGLIILALTFFVPLFTFAQSKGVIGEINEQVYEKFTLAYAQKDLTLFASIQHDDLIRVSGDGKNIRTKSDYLMGLGNWWAQSEDQLTIKFRFKERIYNESTASEIGIYRIQIDNPSSETRYAYGEFHVILTKRTGVWKFLVDYDSSKGNTVGEVEFQAAKDMNDF